MLLSFIENGQAPDQAAWCSYELPACTAVIGLSVEWEGGKVFEPDVKRLAFHEVCHLLLAKLCDMAEKRQFTQEDLNEEELRVIRILENAFLGA